MVPHSSKPLIVLGCLFFITEHCPAAPPEGYKLLWKDEFDGTQLDSTKWIHWLPGKRRHATNVPNAVAVNNGTLKLKTYTENGQHYTGMISTKGIFEPSYGYYEARIKWADAPGSWSAFWSQTPSIGNPIDDPATAGVEIDFVEHREVDPKGKRIASTANFTLHWNGYGKEHKSAGKQTPENLGLDQEFHLYACEWTPESYRFFIDGKMYWEAKQPISKHGQFIILSSEVESGAWAGAIPKDGYGSQNDSKVVMEVDHVRYYSK